MPRTGALTSQEGMFHLGELSLGNGFRVCTGFRPVDWITEEFAHPRPTRTGSRRASVARDAAL